jgi:hypothetical protein
MIFNPRKASCPICTTHFSAVKVCILPIECICVSHGSQSKTATVSLNNINRLGFVAET